MGEEDICQERGWQLLLGTSAGWLQQMQKIAEQLLGRLPSLVYHHLIGIVCGRPCLCLPEIMGSGRVRFI